MKHIYYKSLIVVASVASALIAFAQSHSIPSIGMPTHRQPTQENKVVASIADSVFVPAKSKNEVNRGPRPAVDFYAIPDSMLHHSHLIVKFQPHLEPFLEEGQFEGILELQELAQKWEINAIVSDYDSITYNPKFKERHRKWGLHLWYQINFAKEVPIKEALRDFTALKSIFEIVEPEILLHDFSANTVDTPLFFNDPSFVNQWNYHNTGQTGGTADADIDLPEAWGIETGKKNVIVAILDSGVDTTHTDLKPNFWKDNNGAQIGYNFYSSTPLLNSGNHGTHVAGTIGAVNNNNSLVSGIAGGDGTANSGVSLMICQVSNAAGSAFSSRAIKRAFIWSADNGATIAQNSWGTLPPNTYNTEAMEGIDYFIENGGGEVLDKGLVVFSAGNSNLNAKIYPAAYERVIAVAATNHKDIRANYSSYGTWVDISAPGGEGSSTARILSTVSMSTNGGIGNLIGTSQASPHVTGVAALILSKLPGMLSSDDVRSVLLQQADNIDHLNSTYAGLLGHGRLNAYQSLLKAQQVVANSSTTIVENFQVHYNSCGSVQLTWNNPQSKKVVIAANDQHKGFIGIPNGTYQVGDTIVQGGGKIVYVGTGNTFTFTPTHYADYMGFKVWFEEAGVYSKGTYKSVTEVTPCSQPILYVKAGGQGDGSSWANASGDLQQMIEKAAPGTAIYIAKGIYTPQYIGGDLTKPAVNNRNNYFLLTKRVRLYGGFPDDNNAATLNHRNTDLYTTVLSGDFLGNDEQGNPASIAENSHHVFVTVNVRESNSIVLVDGLTISGGNANGSGTTKVQGIAISNTSGGGWYNAGGVFVMNNTIIKNNSATSGGGWYNLSGSSSIQNVVITNNTAAQGAGMYSRASNPLLYQCTITDNTATGTSGEGGGIYNYADSPSIYSTVIARNTAARGGGVYIYTGSPLVVNSAVVNNTVTGVGGGIYHRTGSLRILSTTLSSNAASTEGGGIYSTSTIANAVTIGNVIVWANRANTTPQIRTNTPAVLNASYAIIQDATENYQHYIFNFDPEFTDLENQDYRLSSCSPAINLGNNNLLAGMGIANDLTGQPRVYNSQIDLGGYEYQASQSPTSLEDEYASAKRPVFSGPTVLNDGCNYIVKVQEVNSPTGNLFTAQAKVAPTDIITTNGWNFVKRYVQVTPTNDANSLFARLTLYFTKEEFDTYNATYAYLEGKSLPDNLRIIQFQGTPEEGSEHQYTVEPKVITPNINDMKLNVTTGIWEVSFEVNGFSTFYVSGQSTPEEALPVTLLHFKAFQEDNRTITLNWETVDELNFKHFEVERSLGTLGNFKKIGTIEAIKGSTANNYTFTDLGVITSQNAVIYYRLKIIDLDNSYTYSKIESVINAPSQLTKSNVFPNPTSGSFQVTTALSNYSLSILDMAGRVVYTTTKVQSSEQIDISHLPTGNYIVSIKQDAKVETYLITKL